MSDSVLVRTPPGMFDGTPKLSVAIEQHHVAVHVCLGRAAHHAAAHHSATAACLAGAAIGGAQEIPQAIARRDPRTEQRPGRSQESNHRTACHLLLRQHSRSEMEPGWISSFASHAQPEQLGNPVGCKYA